MRKVLIADDAAFMRTMLKDILTRGGYEISAEASTGNEAVDIYQKLKPDIVTMDITMPKMDGLTALKKIMAIDPKAKVIMCSAMGQQSIVIESIQAGAKDFIVKPFQPHRLLEALQKLHSD